MSLIVVGILAIVMGFVLANTDSPFKPYTGIIRIVGLVIVLIGARESE